jgi:hypothetical protein
VGTPHFISEVTNRRSSTAKLTPLTDVVAHVTYRMKARAMKMMAQFE